MFWQKPKALLAAGLLVAAVWFIPLRWASAEMGKYFGYVATRGMVLDEQGNAIWATYTQDGSYQKTYRDANGAMKTENVLVPGTQVRQYRATGAFKDAIVISRAEYEQYLAIYRLHQAEGDLFRRSDFQAGTFRDTSGQVIPEVEKQIGPNTYVVLVRKLGLRTPGSKLILAQFPVYPEERLAIDEVPVANDLNDPYCSPRIVNLYPLPGEDPNIPCSREPGVNQPELSSPDLANLLVSTQVPTEGQILITSKGKIAYHTDYMSPMLVEKRKSLGYTGIFSGFCNQTPLVALTVDGATVGAEDYKRRFEMCDARVVDTIPGDGTSAEAPMVWGPLPNAYVFSGAALHSGGMPTNQYGRYELDYFYLAGLPMKDRLAVGVVFAPHNPKVPYGSRFWTYRDVEGGPTFVSNKGVEGALYNEAAAHVVNPTYSDPGYITSLNSAYLNSIGGDPTYSNYLGWLTGALVDTHQPRSYNIAVDGAYIFGPVVMENAPNDPIIIDNNGDGTVYKYADIRYPEKGIVDVPYPKWGSGGSSGGGESTGTDGSGGATSGSSSSRTGYARYQTSGGTAGGGVGGSSSGAGGDNTDLADQGLLQKISRKDIEKKTEFFVFNGNGAFMSNWRGVWPRDIEGMNCDQVTKLPFGSISSPCTEGQTTNCVHCALDPTALTNTAAFNISNFLPQNTFNNRYKILVINRATGYVGTGYIDMTKVNGSGSTPGTPQSGLDDKPIFAKDGSPTIKMRPPNLVIRARRAPAGAKPTTGDQVLGGGTGGEPKPQVIGFEGAGLTSDHYIWLDVEWRDWDGAPLPDLPEDHGMTGRVAGVSIGGDVLKNKESFVGNFKIPPNQKKPVWLRTTDFSANLHYYVHVTGESPTECAKTPDWCSGFGVSDPDNNTGAPVTNPSGKLQFRPSRYAPFKVPVFDEEATKSAVLTAARVAQTATGTLGKVEPIYRELYRPEYQFTVFDLAVSPDAQTTTEIDPETGKSKTKLTFTYSLTPGVGDQYALPTLGADKVPIWSVGYEELLAIAGKAGSKAEFTNLDELLRLSPARQLLELEDIAEALSGSAFLGLQLYLDKDRGNALYENKTVPLLLAQASPISLTRHVSLARFPADTIVPGSIEDYRAIRFAVTGPASVNVTPLTADGYLQPIQGMNVDKAGVYYLILDTELLREYERKYTLKLPSSFLVELSALPLEAYDGIAYIPHKVYFPVRYHEVVDSPPLGQVIEHEVNITDGAPKVRRQDFAIEGLGPNLALERDYIHGSPGGTLGPGWSHTFELQLIPISTTEYASLSKPSWRTTFPRAIESAPSVDDAIGRPDVPYELSRLAVNGTTFIKNPNASDPNSPAWIAEYGRHGTLVHTGARCDDLDKQPDCYVYTSPDGTVYRYSAPDPKVFAAAKLGTDRTMINVSDGLFTRIGLDPNELVMPGASLSLDLPAQPEAHYEPMPLRSIKDKYGNPMTLEYEDGKLTRVTDAVSRSCSFTYDAYLTRDKDTGVQGKCRPEKTSQCQRLMKVTCLDSGQTTEPVEKAAQIDVVYTYREDGYLESAKQGRREEKYEYEEATSIKDNPDRKLVSTLKKRSDDDAENEKDKILFKYKVAGDGETVTIGDRHEVRLNMMVDTVTYPPTKALDEEPSVLTVKFDYDVAGSKRTVTAGSHAKTYTLNVNGNPTQIDEPRGKVTTMDWSTPWDGNAQYADIVVLRKTVKRDGEVTLTTTYGYDKWGHVIDELGPGSQHIEQVWTPTGVLTSRKDSLHKTEESWEVETSPYERVKSHTDRNGVKTVYTYVSSKPGKVETETIEGSDPLRTIRYGYDDWGNLGSRTVDPYVDEESLLEKHVRDRRGRVVNKRDGLRRWTKYEYDQNDLKTVTLPGLSPNSIASNLVVDSRNVLSYEYDDAGNRTSESDRNGVTLTHKYTALGQVYWTQRSSDRPSESPYREFRYDILGHLRQETDWEKRPTVYDYDELGFQKSITDRTTKHTMFTNRDLLGNVVEIIDYGGLKTQIVYDEYGKEKTRSIEECPENDCGSPVQTYPISFVFPPGIPDVARAKPKYSISRSDERDKTTIEVYDGLDRMVFRSRLGETGPLNYAWIYDAAGMLVETVNEEGLHTKYTYDERGFKTKTEVLTIPNRSMGDVPSVVTTTYGVSDTGKVTWEKRNGRTVVAEYKYDEWDRLISRRVPWNGVEPAATEATESMGYDGNGNLVWRRDFAGDVRTWHRDQLGRVMAYVDAETIDNSKKPYSGSCENGISPFTQCYDYNPNGTVKQQVDARGVVTVFGYDEEDREMSRIETAEGPKSEEDLPRTRSWAVEGERDAMGNIVDVREHDGLLTSFTYTARHLVKSKTHGERYTEYTYTPTRKAKEEISHVEGSTTYKKTHIYDDFDRLEEVTYEGDGNGVATEAKYTYDKVGNVTSVTNRAGERTTKVYDGLLRHEATLQGDEDAKVLQNHYGQITGNIEKTVDGVGKQTKYFYDVADRVEHLEFDNELGRVTRIYNNQGLLKDETIPGGYLTHYEYDREGRVTSRTLAGEKYSYTYDLAGNKLTETQPEGQVGGRYAGGTDKSIEKFKRYHYDAFGRLDSVTDEADIKTVFHTDDAGRQDDVLGPLDNPNDPNIPHIHRDYDSTTGRLTAVKKDLEGSLQAVTAYDEFDRLDRPTQVVRPNGTTLTKIFDKYDRVTSVGYSPAAGASGVFGIVSTTSDYQDSQNQVTITEKKVWPDGTSPSADVTIEQNDVGKSFTRTSTQGGTVSAPGTGTVISYTYDHNGKKQSISLPNGRGNTSYSYDARGRLETVTMSGYSAIIYSYQDGQSSSSMTVSLPSGASTKYDYNEAHRVASITHTFPDGSQTQIGYTYDRNGNPLKITDVATDANNVTHTDITDLPVYDAIGRLRQFSQGGKTTIYTYEGYDRKTETLRDGGGDGAIKKTRTYTYDKARRLTKVVEVVDNNTVTYAYGYDKNGNLLSRTNDVNPAENMVFTYNARDELVRVTKGGTVVGEYDYDSQGRRIRQRGTDRGDVDSIYDDNSILEETLFKDGVSQRHRFHYGLTLLARLATGGVSAAEFYHQDLQRTTRHLSDASGAPVVGYKHDPWGNVREQSGDTSNRMTYTQQQYDPATGLYYYGARFYDPQVGRFLTEDTYQGDAFSPPSLNAYLYANSNPARFIDPTGHCASDLSNPNQNCTPATPWFTSDPEGPAAPVTAGTTPVSGNPCTACSALEDPTSRTTGAQARVKSRADSKVEKPQPTSPGTLTQSPDGGVVDTGVRDASAPAGNGEVHQETPEDRYYASEERFLRESIAEGVGRGYSKNWALAYGVLKVRGNSNPSDRDVENFVVNNQIDKRKDPMRIKDTSGFYRGMIEALGMAWSVGDLAFIATSAYRSAVLARTGRLVQMEWEAAQAEAAALSKLAETQAAQTTALVPYLEGPDAINRVARMAHNVLAGDPIAFRNQAVAVVRVRLPDGSITHYASASAGRLSPAQANVLEAMGIPEENILRGAQYTKGFSRLENHAERIILRNLPRNSKVEDWGISWAGNQKPIPCSICRPYVENAGGVLQLGD